MGSDHMHRCNDEEINVERALHVEAELPKCSPLCSPISVTPHPTYFSPVEEARCFDRCAINTVTTSDLLPQCLSWRSPTGTERDVGSLSACADDIDELQRSSDIVFTALGEPMVGGIIQDALKNHMEVCNENRVRDERTPSNLVVAIPCRI